MPNHRVLDDWIDSYMEYTHNSEPPTQFRKWCAISAIASCLQRKCFLSWGTLTFYPNMYVVLVGRSGLRKGTAMGPAYSLLRELGIKMAAEATTRESLIRELKQSNDTVVDPKNGDMHLHSSITIYSQELTVFLGYNNVQLMSDLTDWYDCRGEWTYRTKNMGTDEIIGVWVNLIGATTPELIQTTLPMDAIGGGLTSRIIFVYADKKAKVVATPFLTEREHELRVKLLHDLELIRMMAGQFRVTEGFLDRWVKWYHAQEGNPPFHDKRFGGYIERRPNHLLKLSLIVASSRGNCDYVITEKDFDRALNIMAEVEAPMQQVFAGYGRSMTADITSQVLSAVIEAKQISIAALMQRFYHDADRRTMEGVIQTLMSMKVVRLTTHNNDSTLTYIGSS